MQTNQARDSGGIEQTAHPQARVVKRHSVFTRVWHWINLLTLVLLFMSGLQIFNAHPALYWGSGSTFAHPLLSIGAHQGANGQLVGGVTFDGRTFTTTGVLGVSQDQGQAAVRAFPSWITLPGTQWLSLGREWHFTAAWLFAVSLVVYLIYSLVSRRRRHTLAPRADELRALPHTIVEHAKFHFERVANYNPIQKLTYLLVLFVMLPLMIATGLSMSPFMDAVWPWLPAVFGGHQSARTIHFVCAFALVGFFFVHVVLVLISGLFNNIRSMVTGGYRVSEPRKAESVDGAEVDHV